MQTIIYFLKLTLKNRRYTAILYISLCFIVCFLLSCTRNPLSDISRGFFTLLQINKSSDPVVSLVEIERGYNRPLTAGRIFSAVGCAIHNGASSIVLLMDSPAQVHESNAVLDSLLGGESVYLDAFAQKTLPDKDSLIRAIGEESRIHLAFLAKEGKSADIISDSDILTMPDSPFKAQALTPAGEFYRLCDSYIPQAQLTVTPLSAKIGNNLYPHAAIASLTDLYGKPLGKSWLGLRLPGLDLHETDNYPVSFTKPLHIPLENGIFTRVHRHKTLFTDSGIQELNFSDAAEFYTLLSEKDRLFSILSEASGNDVYSEIASARRMFLYNSFPFVSIHEDNLFFRMYKEAADDARQIEENLLKNIKTRIENNTIQKYSHEEISNTLASIESLNKRLSALNKIEGTVCIISTLPTYSDTTLKVSPAMKCAETIDSIVSKTAYARAPWLLSLLIIAGTAYFVFKCLTSASCKRPERSIIAAIAVLALFQLVLFAALSLYIDFILVQGGALLSLGCFYLEKPLRSLYEGSVRLQNGVNLPSTAVKSIASSPQLYDLESSQKAFIVENSIDNYEVLSQNIPEKTCTALLKKIYKTVSTHADMHDGAEIFVEDLRFGFCFLAMPESPASPALNAVNCALEIQQSCAHINKELEKKTGQKVIINTALAAGTVQSILHKGNDAARILYTGSVLKLPAAYNRINSEYEAGIVLPENVYMKLKDSIFVRLLDRVRLTQSKHSTTMYQLLPNTPGINTSGLLERYNSARQLFYARNFQDARKLFRSILKDYPDDGPSRYFFKKCAFYIKNGSPLKRTVDFDI